MAKKKTRILWLSKDSDGYYFWSKEPSWDKYLGGFCGGTIIKGFGGMNDIFNYYYPALKLRKNTKCKLKLTQLKNGIKLEKVK